MMTHQSLAHHHGRFINNNLRLFYCGNQNRVSAPCRVHK
jgi:hypothetical protein